ncbi:MULTISPECIES: rhodanese-like domain-containing protein [Halobacteriovorax]|uniref:Rhodanese-like domain-containing protein n=1 Tax=Halobacteriovorax vibrionivorans TaxID=2152716 RepID=A0ABY0III6_9BACT|nr:MULTISPECIES: rhodanese-like domain-containing protein [Halobacteriovorax]AYF45706.1 rhodanese-like protein [Halobacteriovorax sp. BALOs_7]RZF22768.1 rhodanese-like domain-containing protein [Halobacteriovorax vibrionivorans]TGD46204.1 rhodanese-like domain-containing protein [Halobacteriovorax sp. Y22]
MINFMEVGELKDLMDKNTDLILVDCREQDEWDAGHIEEAIFIPLSDFANQYANHLKDKSKKIVVQCRSGKRSLNACQFLLEEGFEDLYNLEGGILAWGESGYPIKA